MLACDLCNTHPLLASSSQSLLHASSHGFDSNPSKGGFHVAGCQLRHSHLAGASLIYGNQSGKIIWTRDCVNRIENAARSRSWSLVAKACSSDRCIRPAKHGSDVSCTGIPLESAVVTAEREDAEEVDNSAAHASASKCVLVVGATGGVGQLVTAALLDRGIQVRALLRDIGKGLAFFGDHARDKLQVCTGDTRQPDNLDPSLFEGVTHVICCTGTTAFPSKRWFGDNTPEQTDWHGVRNLVAAVPSTVQKFVLVSSVGVTRCDQLPWSIMNLFGVLKFKKMGEDFLRASGIPYTVIRPGRLTDGPYTSYDLNTLLKATAGNRRAVIVDQGNRNEKRDI
ncbi:hypothetical protein O6H91_07G069300 [Diphasiastrum complanatum]|uniref:Uncharacterized protein n=1 Tax=Diphasiastrum complanatum TaxID=34168 RepID=A0ACC2D689_DIPCM|nr:hypothetical protein O6H91_07G069300 [Diphasiastrum complanatum]